MNKHDEAARRSAVELLECLTDALAWYYDEIYDGPGVDEPYWPGEGRELLGKILRPDARFGSQLEIADAVIFGSGSAGEEM